MQRTDLSFQQIYNNLLAGSKLALYFPDASAAETFRTRLHHHKSAQEKMFLGLGLAVEDEKTVLRYKVTKGEGEDVVAEVAFVAPSPLKKYPVILLEEKDTVSGGTEIPSSVG